MWGAESRGQQGGIASVRARCMWGVQYRLLDTVPGDVVWNLDPKLHVRGPFRSDFRLPRKKRQLAAQKLQKKPQQQQEQQPKKKKTRVRRPPPPPQPADLLPISSWAELSPLCVRVSCTASVDSWSGACIICATSCTISPFTHSLNIPLITL